MNPLAKFAASTFDYLYFCRSKDKTCSRKLDPDLFDGTKYTIDEFYASCAAYFDKPWEFFVDFRNGRAVTEVLSLRDGAHEQQHLFPKATVPVRMMLYDSPVETEWKETNIAPFKWFSDAQNRSSTIILFVPGWGRSSQSIEEKMCYQLQQLGIDTGLLTVPFQQARTPPGAYTGEYFISGNLFWTLANFRHLVAEIRLLIQYMRTHYAYIGLLGQSSGGFQACLASNCEEIDFLFPYITGCQLGSITWHGMITQFVRKDIELKGVDEEGLNRVWSITDELFLGRHCKAKYRKNYIALYDKVVPTKYQFRLWEVLGKGKKMELECAHYSSVFVQKKVAADIARFIKTYIGLKA